jgi:hypothetical protein
MLRVLSICLSRERVEARADERRALLRDSVVVGRFTVVTLGVDLGDSRLETAGAMEGTEGTAMFGGGGG